MIEVLAISTVVIILWYILVNGSKQHIHLKQIKSLMYIYNTCRVISISNYISLSIYGKIDCKEVAYVTVCSG